MSKLGDFEWPQRSPKSTAPDLFLCCYLKSEIYVNKPRTLDELKANIRQEIATISAEALKKMMYTNLLEPYEVTFKMNSVRKSHLY